MRHSLPVIAALLILAALAVPASPASAQVHEYITSWGSLGSSGEARFSGPTGAAVDYLGNLYVADTGNSKIQKYNNVGGFIAEWGGIENGTLASPMGIAIDGNSVYVIDNSLDAVVVYDLDGNYQFSWGENGAGPGQFALAFGIKIYNDTVYVTDTGNSRVQTFTLEGEHIRTFGDNPQAGSSLHSPVGIAAGPNGTVFISDASNAVIYQYSSEGEILAEISGSVGGADVRGHGMAVDVDGNLYVTDANNNRIVRLDPNGNSDSVWGTYGTGIYQFIKPTDAVIDPYGQLFIVDSGAHSVKKFATPSTVYDEERIAIRDAARATFEAATAEENPPEQAETEPEATPEPAQAQATPAKTAPQIIAVPGDLKRPTIHAPHDITIEAVGTLTEVDIGTATANDESGILSLENNAPDVFTLGINTVIWTAIDGARNSAIDTQMITIVDTIPPTVNDVLDVVLEAVSPDRNYVNIRAPVATDVVGVMDITSDAPSYFPIGTTPVTWTAYDIVGNTASTTHYITIIDTSPPQIRAPPDITTEAASVSDNEVFLGDPVVTDNGMIVSVTSDAPQRFSLGIVTVTWTAADSSGNIGQDTQIVTLTDTTSPTASILEDIIVEATSATQNTVELSDPAVSDIQELRFENDAPETYPIGTTIVTWTITDVGDLASTVEQTVQVLDTTPPSITVMPVITAEATGYDGNTASLGDITVSDVSDIDSITNDAPETFSLGSTTVTWKVTDIYNNTGTAVQRVEIVDTTPPSIFAPTNIIAEYVGEEGNVVEIGIPVVSDLVGIADISDNAPPIFGLGTTEVVWSATDQSGNQAFATQVVSIADTTKPEISAPEGITVEATSEDGTQVILGRATATDLSGIVQINNDAPALFELGTTVVTWDATDTSGNIAAKAQIVIVQDTIPPTLDIPSDLSVEASSQHGNSVQIGQATGHDTVGSVTITNNAPIAFSIGTTTVAWIATDSAGNTTSKEQLISIVDTTPPTISAPSDITVEAAVGGTSAEIGQAIAEDEVKISTVTNDAPRLFDVGITVVTWTVTDGAGNTATDTQSVTVIDTTPPNLIAPYNMTFEAISETENVVNIGTGTYSDEQGTATVTNDAPTLFALGQTTVLWTATDVDGNAQTAKQVITIVDTTPPEITAPPRIEAEATSHEATPLDIGIADATDAVKVESISNNAPDGFALGTTTIAWTATDSSGNAASAIQQITISDTTPPELNAPDDITIEAISDAPVAVDIGAPAVSDAGSSTITITNDAPELFELGRTLVSWTASDSSGNVASTIQAVTIVDTTAPALEPPQDILAEADSAVGTVLHVGEPEISDNTRIVELTNDAPEIFPLGKTLVAWTARDTSGITTSATQLVEIVDTTPPQVIPTSDVTVEAQSTNGTHVQLVRPYITDAVGIESVSNDAPSLFRVGSTQVTWTVADGAGNVSVALQFVTVTDTTPPTISQTSDIIVNATSQLTQVDISIPESSDLVDQRPMLESDEPESYPLGTTTITWTATDISSNSATMTQSVTVLACGISHTEYNMISGTVLDDTLDGTEGSDLIFGLSGDDVITGGSGDDCIFGGEGDDIIIGGRGDDTVDGGSGDDVIRGQQGDDVLAGALGSDTINGGEGSNTCPDTSTSDAVSRCES